MKHTMFAITLLAAISLVACVTRPATAADPVAVLPVTDSPVLPATQAQTTAAADSEETQLRTLVENFGKRLQNVSLQSPDAAQEMETQYSEYVSPALLETWMTDPSIAPGRMVSSPWPDRIEIATIEQVNSDKYVVRGSVIEVTSTEVASGEAANKIPVQIVVERAQGRWLLTAYAQEQ